MRVGLSHDYPNMHDSLWYPPATVGNASATVTPYDCNNLEVPRAMGGTCYAMGLMLAYNQFSGNTSLLTYNPGAASGDAGGNGRKGAQKIIIFETDGAPNTTASPTLNNLGSTTVTTPSATTAPTPAPASFPQHQRLHRQRLDRDHADLQPLHAARGLGHRQPAGLLDDGQESADPLHRLRPVIAPGARHAPAPSPR